MPIIKKTLKEAFVKKVDESLTVTELFSNPEAHFDIAIADMNGSHGVFRNDVSDKVYMVLEGTGVVSVGEESVPVGPMDVVFIPPGQTHSITGSLKFLVMMSPAFDPKHEQYVGPVPEAT